MKLIATLLLLWVAFAASFPILPSNPSLQLLTSPQPLKSHPQVLNFEERRQSSEEQNAIASDPVVVDAASTLSKLPEIAGNTHGNDNDSGDLLPGDGDEFNYPWNEGTFFNPNSVAVPTAEGGWASLPEVAGFTLNRTFAIMENAIQPFYITSNYDPSKIKRAIIVMPGKPRDSWKYTTLMGNALNVSVNGRHSDLADVKYEEVIVIGPAWLNQLDRSSLENELVFHGSQWQSGGYSRSPKLKKSITSYEVLDGIADLLFDKAQFPSMNQVVLAGHSEGGQAVMRYSLLKKTKSYDRNMRFWIGNPGSWAWLTEDRAYPNSSCPHPDQWPYGLGGDDYTSVPKYARSDVIANKQAVIDRFRSRNVHYAFGLLDNGPGDTHCQAIMQGGNHLDRGAQFVEMLGGMKGGFPVSHSVDFLANVSHQNYPMFSANVTLKHLFATDYNLRHPEIIDFRNPGDIVWDLVPASSVLGGLSGIIVLIFVLLSFLFPADKILDLEQPGEEGERYKLLNNSNSSLGEESQRSLARKKKGLYSPSKMEEKTFPPGQKKESSPPKKKPELSLPLPVKVKM